MAHFSRAYKVGYIVTRWTWSRSWSKSKGILDIMASDFIFVMACFK